MMRVLCILGTRPEAIKMAPIIKALESRADRVELRVCVTGQHREMLDQMLSLFGIRPDIDLGLMRLNQDLASLTSRALLAIGEVIEQEKPDWLVVLGDTTTTMTAAMAGFYQRIQVGHVEAGLRSFDPFQPFPEEINRRLAGVMATYHFAPCARAQENLLAEGIRPEQVFLTGNTIVDAIRMILESPLSQDARDLMDGLGARKSGDKRAPPDRRILLVTAHRRESFGAPFEELCISLREIADKNDDVLLVYPVHLNPNVREPALRILSEHPRVELLPPLSYEPFVRLLDQSYLVLTDSGGIQEEASVLGKPTLILRDKTERPEVVEAGIGRLVGTNRRRIIDETERLLNDKGAYMSMARQVDLYGDGTAGERIADILLDGS